MCIVVKKLLPKKYLYDDDNDDNVHNILKNLHVLLKTTETKIGNCLLSLENILKWVLQRGTCTSFRYETNKNGITLCNITLST